MKKFVLLVFLLMLLSGCVNGDRYNFSGGSENWEVFYVVDVSNETNQEKSGTIKYVGEGSAPEMIDYKIEANAGGSFGNGVTLIDGVVDAGSSICKGCAITQEDEEIEVEIKWEDQTENLILTINK